MGKNICTIKIGGEPAGNDAVLAQLCSEMKGLASAYDFVVVHGGGDEVSALTRHFGIEPVFVDGVRMTAAEEMKFVDMVLCGAVNKRLVRSFNAHGVSAAGLSGSDGRLFVGKSIGKLPGSNAPTHTGKISAVNPGVLTVLIGAGFVPVIASTSMNAEGVPLNINADAVAFEIASTLESEALVFFSDIPGILKNGDVLSRLRTGDVPAEINKGTITGGMIPKVKASMDALSRGVKRIIIGEYAGAGSLSRLLNGQAGTVIE
jgi:acetylglutamate kinase